jgi:hypothetical protein
MSLTEIIEQLEEARCNCQSDMNAEWNSLQDKLTLSVDLGQLKTAIAILIELRDSGSEQFFSGCISK